MTKTEKIENFLSELNTEIDVLYMVDVDSVESYEDVYDAIENNSGFNIDIIYYGTAMDYLRENDASLKESLGLAAEMCFSLENLNSEKLASLLASRNVREEFEGLSNEITDFFYELENEEEEEDED